MDTDLVAALLLAKSGRVDDFLFARQLRRERNETSLGLDGHAHFVARMAAFLTRHRRPICVACLSSSVGMLSVYFFSLFDFVVGVFR